LPQKSFVLAGLAGIALLAVAAPARADDPVSHHAVAGLDLTVTGDLKGFTLAVSADQLAPALDVVTLALKSPTAQPPPRFSVKWAVPSHNVEGAWTPTAHFSKGTHPDWARSRLEPSMFARSAPVTALFGNDDANVLTFAISDAQSTLLSGAGVREEDGLMYSEVVFFSERHPSLTSYTAKIRIDRRPVPFQAALADVAAWWAAQPGYEPAKVPDAARQPVYSTWYNYHQKVDAAALLKELEVAKQMGFATIIVDDGWQTLDSARGYAFTGDWRPERMPDMKGFVDAAHKLGIKVMLWYAVPFVGKQAKVVDRFVKQTLRFEERLGAYVLDPRYPEVRAYLIGVYKKAMADWGIDGFKLDFIERFVADDKTVLDSTGGRDFASVNEATDRLMTDIMAELRRDKPDVMIEFRQPYIGPLIRKYGNMFRASDCPNSYLANRVRTLDLRLLSGATAVHADMIMWHAGEPVELAAFQLLNVMFSVPQVSVRLREIPKAQVDMIKFYVGYWTANRAVLLDGALGAQSPGENYPIVTASSKAKQIVGLYRDQIVRLGPSSPKAIDVINAKRSEDVVLQASADLGRVRYSIRNCQGVVTKQGTATLHAGPTAFKVPVSGLIAFERI
jgi:alpha-galactosidase